MTTTYKTKYMHSSYVKLNRKILYFVYKSDFSVKYYSIFTDVLSKISIFKWYFFFVSTRTFSLNKEKNTYCYLFIVKNKNIDKL